MNTNYLLDLYAQHIWPIHRMFIRGLAKRCKNCILSEKYCTLKDGICEKCLDFKRTTKPFKSNHLAFNKLIKSTKGKTYYDASLLLSGGKDSAYVLDRLRKEYPNLKIICIAVDTGFMSQHAIENAKKIAEKTNTDILIVNMHVGLFASKLKEAFLKLKEGKGSYGIVDFTEGSLIYQTGIDITKNMNIPVMIGGLSWVQVEQILGSTDFIEEKQGLKTIFPLAVWKTGEEDIRSYVLEKNLIPKGQDSPIVSNSQLILPMCAIDMINLGYCSFEPEFAQLIREGKASREHWLKSFQLLEYGVKTGRILKDVNKTLSKLNLTLKDVTK